VPLITKRQSPGELNPTSEAEHESGISTPMESEAEATAHAGNAAAHHNNTNDPTADEKAALAGTGTPGAGNVYVNEDKLGTAAAKNTSDFVESGTNKARGTVYQTASGNRENDVAGNWYDWAGTFAAGDLQDFTHSGGVLTYTGTATRVFRVSANLRMRAVGAGTPAWSRFGVSVNNADPDVQNERVFQAGGTWGLASGSAIVTLSTGDTVRLKSEAHTGAAAGTYVWWDDCVMTVSE